MSEFDFEALNIIEQKLFAYAHQVDDLHNNLATLRRATKNAISRLENALEANDENRSDIVKEFIEIAVDNLNLAIEKTSRKGE